MATCNAVQQKISCVFVTGVKDGPSPKRSNQQFKVTASEELHPDINPQDISAALVSEKLDGTCCLIQDYQGRPWLWARLDRKPNKTGDKKFNQHQAKLRAWREQGGGGDLLPPTIHWDQARDFKEAPVNWIPASGVEVKDSVPQPDTLGHTPGWVPLEKTSRQYCWHLSAVDLDAGVGLVLTLDEEGEQLIIQCQPLAALCGRTCELIGTNINGNPYHIGSKKQPLHMLVPHGALPLVCPSPLSGGSLHQWLASTEDSADNRVEGVVWHCPSGKLFKLHRHHLNLPWPIPTPRLSQLPVTVAVDSAVYGLDTESGSLFAALAGINGQKADTLCSLGSLLSDSR